MSYRDVSESLRAYRDRVAADLELARQAAKEAAERAGQVEVLQKELAETEGLLAKVARTERPRALPLLENLAIAAPCTASWDEMVGDERVRFCGDCQKNVYNLSAMPRDEAEALLAAREGRMCVRLYKRADGTVLTSDCEVGVKRRRRRRALAGVVGGGLLAAGAALSAATTRTTMGGIRPTTTDVRPMQGDVEMMGGPMMGTPPALTDPPPAPTTVPTAPHPIVGRPMIQGHVMMGAPPPLPPQKPLGKGR